jgi:medium-chain acyl-[acyl-carrier-protein] hydrolase
MVRLFCLPYAGSGASVYRPWADALPDTIEVCAVQLPGRENRLREPPFTAMSALVTTLTQELLPWLDRPFALFGHSMGAWISFELARALQQNHSQVPVHLFVSGRHAPQLPSRTPPIYTLPDAAFLAGVRDHYGGMPAAILDDAELLAFFLPLLRADITLVQTHTYIAGPLLTCPIAAFGGEQDPTVWHTELAGWYTQTRASFALHMFPGGHFYIKPAPRVLFQTIAQLLETD